MMKPATIKTIDCSEDIKVEIFDRAYIKDGFPFGVRMHDYGAGETVFPVYQCVTIEKAEKIATKMVTGR